MLFFVATVGRSGSNWLCHVLDQSPTHRVEHETADPRYGSNAIHGWAPFPLARFLERGPNYGEVHGFLRYNLSAAYAGLERSIPKRAALERASRDVIRSWYCNAGPPGECWDEEFAAICFEVLTQQRLLREWAQSNPGSRIVSLEQLTTDLDALRDFCDWLRIDCRPKAADQAAPHNPTPAEQPEWDWTPRREAVLERIAARMNFKLIESP